MDNNIIFIQKMIVYLLKPRIFKPKIVCYACHKQSVKTENEAINIIKYLTSI